MTSRAGQETRRAGSRPSFLRSIEEGRVNPTPSGAGRRLPSLPSSSARGARSAGLAAAFLFSLAGSVAQGGFLSEKTTPLSGDAPRVAPWGLNRAFLLPEHGTTIVFVVQLVSGHRPEPRALDTLVRVASRYGEGPARWVDASNPGVPRLVFASGKAHLEGGEMETGASYVFILYKGTSGKGYGAQGDVSVEGRSQPIPVISIQQDRVRRHRFLWITDRHLEERDLLHEYGHLLGLGTNPAHAYYARYPSLSGGPHCTRPDCALALPRARAIAYTLLRTLLTFHHVKDYCPACRQDIALAKGMWRKVARSPSSARVEPAPESVPPARATPQRRSGSALVEAARGRPRSSRQGSWRNTTSKRHLRRSWPCRVHRGTSG